MGYLDLCRLATIGNESPGFVWVSEGGSTKRVTTAYAANAPPCRPDSARPAAGSSSSSSGSGGGASDVLSKIGGSILGALSSGAKGSGASAAYQQSMVRQGGTPEWLLPVAIGGIGLLVVVMIARK